MDCCEQKYLLYLSSLPLQFKIMKKQIQPQCKINDFHKAELGFEVRRIIGWKRTVQSSNPTVNPTPPCLLNHIPKCHICMFFEHLQGWWLYHLPGQPIPMLDHSFSKDIFPNIQFKLPLTQLEVIASRPITCYSREETNTCLTEWKWSIS